MSLLPSRPDAQPAEDASPRVIDVESEDADRVLAALSSETARSILNELHDDPAPASELADRIDSSVQNVKYHLDNLVDADAIEVVETAYSEKGREMAVYAPADQPLVIFAGPEQDRGTLRTALSRLLGSLGILALASVLVQRFYGESTVPWAANDADDDPAEAPADDADEPTADETEPSDDADDGPTDDDSGLGMQQEDDSDVDDADVSDDDTVTDTADGVNETANGYTPNGDDVHTAAETAASVPPGVLFFAGGLLVLLLVVAYVYVQPRRPF